MSVTMVKSEGVTVVSLTSDPESPCPPLCQVFKGLCYSPVCCSVSQHLRKVQRTPLSVFGALHIMVGLLNIGLGAILCSSHGSWWWRMDHTLFPFWAGGVFMLLGAMSILSEKCPSPCLVLSNVILNLAGIALTITTVVLYSISIAQIRLSWMCYRSIYYTPTPDEDLLMENCVDGRELVRMLMTSINFVLIVLSVLELCLVISSAVLGIRALRRSQRRENENIDHPEHLETLPDEDTSNPAA